MLLSEQIAPFVVKNRFIRELRAETKRLEDQAANGQDVREDATRISLQMQRLLPGIEAEARRFHSRTQYLQNQILSDTAMRAATAFDGLTAIAMENLAPEIIERANNPDDNDGRALAGAFITALTKMPSNTRPFSATKFTEQVELPDIDIVIENAAETRVIAETVAAYARALAEGRTAIPTQTRIDRGLAEKGKIRTPSEFETEDDVFLFDPDHEEASDANSENDDDSDTDNADSESDETPENQNESKNDEEGKEDDEKSDDDAENADAENDNGQDRSENEDGGESNADDAEPESVAGKDKPRSKEKEVKTDAS